MNFDNEWVPLLTLQEVAAAQARGDEIETRVGNVWDWRPWYPECWDCKSNYRSRHRKKTKTVVLCEALVAFKDSGWFLVQGEKEAITDIYGNQGIKWLDTPAREIEVE
jgi:hypothetical protein